MTTQTSHPASLTIDALMKQCETRRQRRGGPGGQHRNKVETAIVLTHKPTEISAEASERRSQAENLKVAQFRLRINLALKVRSELEMASFPSQLWKSRIRQNKIQVNSQHTDFPTLLAEALDVLLIKQWDVKSAAELLGSSTSQLVKFLKQEPRAFGFLNFQRLSQDLKPLK
ncbi:MAG: peptide chain release factor-like protein [Blastopirellula sp.]|nr:MAG: peptide chain release factor-like protein [Blastopirellula sp.]